LLVGRPRHQIGKVDRTPDLGYDHSGGNRIEGFGQRLRADAELADPVLVHLDAQALHRLVPVEIDQPGIRVLTIVCRMSVLPR
jgi:hypothetical protein